MPTLPSTQPANQRSAALLNGELDQAMMALTAFDTTRLEALEHRIRTVTAAHLAGTRELPEIVAKHALLGQMLAATSANLKVLGSVLNLESRMEMR